MKLFKIHYEVVLLKFHKLKKLLHISKYIIRVIRLKKYIKRIKLSKSIALFFINSVNILLFDLNIEEKNKASTLRVICQFL